ncbi:MAG: glycosyltransferase family 2 protein [Candidatus Acidiferrales bacterium]
MTLSEISDRPGIFGELRDECLFVSVLIACRNEEKFIARCLESILANDYPKDRLEILVMDGMSADRTREIVHEYAKRCSCLRLLDNPARSFPAAMNTGIRNSSGNLIIIAGAHAVYQRDHISTCVRFHQESGAENVGGALQVEPGAEGPIAQAIAAGLASRFGSGNSHVKTGVQKPIWADTAAFGCYRRELFDKIGMFDERLLGSSDLDLNRRLRSAGGRILLLPEVVVRYFADATWPAFWRHNFADGFWVTYVLKFGSKAWSWRHWIPFALVASLVVSLALSIFQDGFMWIFLGILGSYAVANIGVSIETAIRKRKGELLLLLPGTFAGRHFAFGAGTTFGLVLLLLPGVRWRGRGTVRVR